MGKNKVPRRIGFAQQRSDNLKKLCQNGITPLDVEKACTAAAEKAFERGKRAAVNELSEFMLKTCYAAALLSAYDEFGFRHKRCMRLLNKMDYHVTYSLTSDELVDQVFEKVGIRINFKGVFEDERISEVDA